MIILDTNVLSAVMMARPPKVVVDWLDSLPRNSVWTTAVTVFEIEYGLRRLPDGKRRHSLQEGFRSLMAETLGGRVLPFDARAALAAAEISAAFAASGRRVEIRDMQIAGISRAHRALLATRNVKDFAQACEIKDPWAEA